MRFQPHVDIDHGTPFATSLFFSYLGSTHGNHCFESALLVFSHFTSIPIPVIIARLSSSSLCRYLLAFVLHLNLLLGYWDSQIHSHTLWTVNDLASYTRVGGRYDT